MSEDPITTTRCAHGLKAGIGCSTCQVDELKRQLAERDAVLREALGVLESIDDTPVDGALWTSTWNADDWLTIRAGTVKRIRALIGESDGT